ncbi:hypothetical protein V6N11_006225 [Hibiscus sabdariffa]|uniref:Uncharacterized protein n=1 Tax=Hibiscus sabdariffa TaxID=183260 RepID=A0ABR2RQ64_9ROSI
MVLSILSYLLSSLFVFSFLQTPTFAVKQSYIVYLGAQTHGLNPTSVDLDAVTNSHYELLGSFVGSTSVARDKIFYSYTRNINGFAAILDEKEAAAIAKHPQVVSVFLNKGRKLHTTRSWDFMRLERDGVIPNDSLWKKSKFGTDVIIGNLDTGVWPESKSFSDHGMGEIPLKWKGLCHSDTKDGVVCNRKLIGASTLDREFVSYAKLGNKKKFKGASLSAAILKSRTSYPLITGEKAKAAGASVEEATLCQPGSIDPKKAKGKILVCLRGINPRTGKGKQALLAGAVGLILTNDEESGNELIADPHFLPATHINFTDGQTVFAYINSTKNPTGYITPVETKLGLKPAPSMAAFSSRGPNMVEPSILKPDITAPGVNILAAVSESNGPTEDESDKRRIPFVPELKGKVTVSRTVKNVGSPRSTYKVRVRSPLGITITVNPSILKFTKLDEEKSFKVTIKPNSDGSQDFVFGELLWSDGKHNVRSPIAVWH